MRPVQVGDVYKDIKTARYTKFCYFYVTEVTLATITGVWSADSNFIKAIFNSPVAGTFILDKNALTTCIATKDWELVRTSTKTNLGSAPDSSWDELSAWAPFNAELDLPRGQPTKGFESITKCECGSDKVNSPKHSDYCPKYMKED